MPQIFTQKSPKNHPKSLQNVTQNQKKKCSYQSGNAAKISKKKSSNCRPDPRSSMGKGEIPKQKKTIKIVEIRIKHD